MTARPIIFSGAMVRALLEGHKTMTRRLLRPQPEDGFRFGGIERDGKLLFTKGPIYGKMRAPYAVGDRLYVRESFRPSDMAPAQTIYRADVRPEAIGPWTPSIHMPRLRSRITLTVEAVKVERLQDISEEDAIAEGVEKVFYEGPETNFQSAFGWKDYRDHPHAVISYAKAHESFQTLWQSLNAKRAPWDSNPWVVAVSFSVAKINIERLAP